MNTHIPSRAKRLAAGAAIAIGALVLGGCAAESNGGDASEEKINLTFAHYLGPTGAQAQSVAGWADRINELTDGRVEIEFFYSQGLLPAVEILAGVSDGRADLGYTGAFYHPQELVLSNMSEIPFLTANVEAQIKAHYEIYNSGGIMQQEFHDNGVHAVLFNTIGSNIIGSKEPLESVDDLAGLSIRATGRVAEALQTVGANPVALTSPEMYEALERGTIDAYSSFPMEIISDFSLPEIAPYLTLPGIGNYTQSVTIINLDVWNSLPDDVQEAFNQASDEYISGAVQEYLVPVEDATCEDIADNGGEVIVWGEEQTSEFADRIGSRFRDGWISDASSKWSEADVVEQLETYESLLEEFEADADYTPGALRCANGE